MRLLGHNVADDGQGPVYNAFAIALVAGGKELADGRQHGHRGWAANGHVFAPRLSRLETCAAPTSLLCKPD
jgi:hypothetical protein